MSDKRTVLAGEIFKTANEIENISDRVRYLRKWDSEQLRILVKAAYNPKIEWVLPEGSVPHMSCEGPARTNLLKASRDLYIYVKGGADSLQNIRREVLFIQLLEALSIEEAELLIFIKDQSVEELYPNLTFEVMELAFPSTLKQS